MRKKCFLLLWALAVVGGMQAQQAGFDEYRRAAGDHAALYSGRVEESYNQRKYLNNPYLETAEFRRGDVCFDGRLYTGERLRYDAYRCQLIVISLERQLSIVADKNRLDYFVVDGLRYVPVGERFGALLYEGRDLRLTEYLDVKMGNEVQRDWVMYNQFDKKVRYSLRIEGKEYTLNTRKDLLKLFPAYKKPLKTYSRKHHLNFKEGRRGAMAALVRYLGEELMRDE